jgi:hypothetical protein
MFMNRINSHTAAPRGPLAATAAFTFIGTPWAPAVTTIYRNAYLRAFAMVEQRVVRRRQLRAARFISRN